MISILLACAGGVQSLFAQAVTNYTFSNSTGTFTALTSPTAATLLAGTTDDGRSNLMPIGFDFWYMGTRYTNVSASTNGWLALGVTQTADELTNNLTSGGSPRPVIAPLWDDLDIVAIGNLTYKTTGSAPNRIFTVQYLNVKWQYLAGGAVESFQVNLHETSGIVEFVYRSDATAASSPTASIGITATATGSGNFLSVANAGTSVSSTVEASVTTKPVTGKTYTFTPVVPNAPTSLTFTSVTDTSMTLNWADNSTIEDGYVIYKSTDGGTTYNFASQTAANATSSAQSGLTASTTYFWKVYAVSEGALSTALAGSQATAAPPATKTFTGTGNFTDTARWTGGTVPVAGENLIIDGACTVDNSGTTDNVAYGTLVIGSTAARTLNWISSGTNRLNVTNVSSGFAASALNMTNGGTLIIGGTWTSTNLTFTSGTGTIEIGSTLTLPAAYATYNNLTVNGSGTTVTQGVGTTVNGNLTVTSGTYTVGALSLAVTGTTTVSSTFTITSATGAKSFGNLVINGAGTFTNTTANAPITISGNLQNDGTFSQGTGRVTFTGATSNTVTGAAEIPTAFGGGITVNKGVANTNVLDVQALITMSSGGLILTNGTFELTSASTITPFTADISVSPYLIPSTAGLWCNGGTISAPNMNWTIAGLLKVTSGTLTVGSVSDNAIVPQATASIVVGGGTLNTASRISDTTVPWSYSMTGGTLNVNTVGSAGAGRAGFNMDAVGNSFSMSGGTIVIQRPAGGAGENLGFYNLGTSGTGFTGGTLQIGNASTPAASIIGITSTNPIYNLTVNSANVTALEQTSALTVTNAITISAGILSANNLALSVGGDWTNNASTSAFTTGTATTTFNGTSSQTIAGSFVTTFAKLTINNSTGVTLGTSTTVSGLLTFTSGNVTTGANNLYLNSTGTVSRTSGHVIGNFKKNFASAALSKTFEIGDSTNYTPVAVVFAAVSVAGDLTASVASGDHANIGSSTIDPSKSVNRNWTLASSGGLTFTNYGATFTFVAGDVDGGANTANFIVGKYLAGWTYPTVGTKTALTTQTTGVTTVGDFQLGEVVVYNTKTWDGGAGTSNWGDAANWNTDGVPTSIDDVNLTGANTININVAAVAHNLTLNNAGLTLTINSGSSLAVAGGVTLTAGTFDMGTNTVSGAGSFTVSSGGNLIIGSTAGITSSGATGNVQVTGTRTFDTAANYTYNGSSAQVTGNGLPATVNNLTVNNSAGVSLSSAETVSGTLTLTSGALSIGANTLTINGAISTTSGSLTGGATSNVTIGGAGASTTLPAVTLNNLTMNRANGITLGGNVTASGVITLTSGVITTGANTLSNSTGTVSRTSGHIFGNFQKNVATGTPSNETFEIGDASTYSPVTVAFASVSVTGNLTASVVSGDHANIGSSSIDSAKSVNRNWTLTNSGITFTTYSPTFTFVSGDIDAGAATATFYVERYSGGSWNYPAVGTKTSTTTQATGVTAFGDFQIGNVSNVGRTYTVNSTTDVVDANIGDGACLTAGGVCTLRAAVQESNANTAADTISVPSGTYTFTLGTQSEQLAASGDLDITNPVTITGAGSSSTIIDANNLDRVFETQNAAASLTINGVTIRNGNPTGNYGGGISMTSGSDLTMTDVIVSGSSSAKGAGIAVSGAGSVLTLTDVTISGNTASDTGGGIFIDAGTATLNRVTISGNSSVNTGGGMNNSATTSLTNVTISGNTAPSSGGGGYVNTTGTSTLLNCTINNNTAAIYANVYQVTGTVSIKNTIIANPVSGTNCNTTITAVSNNLSNTTSCFANSGTNVVSSPVTLGALANNGGLTQTHALVLGSPAIDTGTNTGAPATDQRGTSPQDGDNNATVTTDKGSYEYVYVPLTGGISGTVFEDQNYGGGAGRSLASSSGVVVPSARVELFTGANYTTFATTDGSGNYSFTGLAAATYTVRVVNGTVNSSRTGTEVLPPVQTYRTNASSGTAVAVTDHVGGEVPASVDAGNGSSTLAALTVGAVTPQSITSVVVSASTITGVDFGYSYDVIVNKNNTGQGSLRQFILNANALSNAGLAQSGLTSGIDNAVFMLADGTARAGLQAAYATQFTSGIASITLATALPTISDPVIIDARLQPGHGAVPMIELNGTSVAAPGLTITAGSSTVSGLIINRFTGGTGDGIYISTAGSNTITGNYIGITAAGTAASTNAGYGINNLTANNIIGGTTAADRNVVSGNTLSGILTKGSGNTIEGNYVGTNAAGTAAIANSHSGVDLDTGGTGNTIGGTAAGAGNVISGNTWSGLSFNNSATGNFAYGNYIGTNAAGTAAIGNGDQGVFSNAINNTIGGTSVAARNIISGNLQSGVYLTQNVSGNIVQGNYIGLTAAGGSLANAQNGVRIDSTSSNNTIGGTAAGAGNVISANSVIGVTIAAGCTGNAVRANSIYANTGIGIDLVSVAAANNGTKNGANANSDMDSAVFTSAGLSGTTLTLAGYVGSAASQSTFAGATVEIFKSDNDASGYGEGQTYLGTLTADGSGNLSGTITTGALVVGDKITGTATDASNNTSEFGANFTVTLYLKTFTGTGSFSDATKWTSGTLPVAGENITIDGSCTVDNNGGTDNVAYGTLTIGTATGRTLNWAAGGTNRLNVTNVSAGAGASTLSMTNGGTLIVGGTWTSTNLTFTPGAGTIQIGSTLTLPAAYATYNNLTVNGSGTTVTQGVGTTVNGNLTVTSGTYTVGALSLAVTGTASVTSTLTITSATGAKSFGNLVVNSGGTFTNTAANAPITIAGNLQNDGTFSQGTGRVTFTGATSNTVTGTAATTAFGGGITVNKGVSNANVLDVQGVITMLAGGLTLTNGTFKISSNSTITAFTADINVAPYLIPATAGIWVNGGTVSTTSDMTPAGLIRVSNGTFNMGNVADARLLSSWATFIIEGGAFNIAGRLTRRVAGEGHFFTMSGGTFTVGTIGNTSVQYGPFILDDPGSSFTMSGGTIVVRQSGAAPEDYTNLAGTTNVTGGTVQIGDGSTPAANTIEINSTTPFWDLTINGTNSPVAKLVTNSAIVKHNVTMTSGTLNANNLNITVGNDWTNNVSTAAFTAGTGTVTFNGTGAQTVAGTFATTFNNLIASNTGNTVTSAVNASVAGNLSVSSGTFDLATFTANRASAGGTLTVSNGATLKIGGTNTLPSNYSTHSIGATSTVEYSGTNQSLAVLNSAQDYGYLTISGSGTKTLAGSENVRGTLTFTSGTITTGAFTLYLTSTGTVARTSGHVIGNFKKNVAIGATTKSFEIGDATNYTPVDLVFASVTIAGDLTASVAAGDHASIGTSTINPSKSVNRNWTLTNTTIVFATCSATFTFVAGDLDAGATTSAFIVGKYSAVWTYPIVGTKTATSTQTTGLTSFGDFELGELLSVTKTWDGGASTNNWGDAANWNVDGVPLSTDNVDLTGANTININVAAVANNLLLNNAGLTLTINSGSSLAISGALTLTSGTLNMGTNTVSGAGSFTLSSGGNLGIGSTAGITSSGATGNVQVTGARSFSTAANYTYNGTSAQATGNGLPATVNNLTINNSAGVTLTATVAVSSDLTVTAGTLDLSTFTANRVSAGGTLTVSSGATLKIGGTNTLPANYSTHSIGATSTIEYSGTTQSVAVLNSAQNYGHLTISGSGTKTLAGTNNVAGDLTVSAGTFDLGSFTANRASAGGTLTISSGATLKIGGTNTLPSNFSAHSIGSTSTIEYGGTTQSVVVLNSSQNYGHLTISGSGTKTLAGTNNVAGDLTISAGTFDFSSFTANRASAGGTLSVTNGAGLKIGGTNGFPINYSTNSLGATSTVDYSGTAQAVGAQNYGHLTLSTSGAKTFAAGTIGIAGTFTISGTATANMTANSPTVDYNGSGAQTILGQTYYNLSVSNAGTKTLAATATVNNNLTVSSTATLDLSSFTADRASSGGTLSVASGTTLKIGGTNTLPANYSTHSIGATSTIEYSGTNQSLAVLNSSQDYGHLTISGSGTKTLAGSVNVGGTLTFTSGTITTGASTLYLKSTGTVSRTSGHVIGNFQKNVAIGATNKTFEIGDATNYTPADLVFASVTTAGDLTASVVAGDHANIGTSTINASKTANRNWTLTNSGIVFATYGATFTFVSGDLDAGATTSAFVVGRYSAGWTYPTVGTKTSTTTQTTGLTAFGAFQLGEATLPPNVPLVNSVVPSSPQPPGTDLVYTIVFTNGGGQAAQVFIVTDPIPLNTDFKLGSQGTNLATTGMTVTITYSNDNASTWTYTPVSGAGGAPTGYDRSVTHVRWSFTGNLNQGSPNNTGSVTLTTRIR
jgi:CSLREA domain-containing protein